VELPGVPDYTPFHRDKLLLPAAVPEKTKPGTKVPGFITLVELPGVPDSTAFHQDKLLLPAAIPEKTKPGTKVPGFITLVELPGVEPGSKQPAKSLSTCLAPS